MNAVWVLYSRGVSAFLIAKGILSEMDSRSELPKTGSLPSEVKGNGVSVKKTMYNVNNIITAAEITPAFHQRFFRVSWSADIIFNFFHKFIVNKL
jgi:hypothetical protein